MDLSTTGELADNAGGYPVRLRTPDPVLNGEGFSNTLFLAISTALPVVESISPRGIVIADLSHPDLRGLLEDAEIDLGDLSRVFPQAADITLRLCRDANNAQFRLGQNVGEIRSDRRDDEPLPGNSDSPCAGHRVREVQLHFATERLQDLTEAEKVLSIINPPPGGGTGIARFGITDVIDDCLADGLCVRPLDSRRPGQPSGRGVYLPLRTRQTDQFSGLGWRGGEAAALRNRYRTDDVINVLSDTRMIPQMSARITRETSGGTVPAILGQPFALTIEETLGVQPRVELFPVQRRGDGRFSAPHTVPGPLGREPGAVLAEDFNGDGHLDLVAAQCRSNDLSFRRGGGGLDFQPGVSLRAHGCPDALATADLNSDGLPDLVNTNRTSGTISLREGQPGGGFTLNVNYAMQADPRALSLADFDRDGYVDLVTGALVTSLVAPPAGQGPPQAAVPTFGVLRWGRGPRGVSAPHPLPALGPTRALAVADVNFDGLPDLVVAGGRSISIWAGTGRREAPFGEAAVSTVQVPVLFEVTALAVGDLDADARPDLLAATADTQEDLTAGQLIAFGGQGDGTFRKLSTRDTGALTGLSLGDLNGDGIPDAGSTDQSGAFLLFAGRGDGTFGAEARSPLANAGAPFVIGDVNADGAPDVISREAAFGAEALLIMPGAGREAFGRTPAALSTGLTPAGVVPADLDRDGVVDLISLDEGGQTLTVYRGDGRGGFDLPRTIQAGFPVTDGLVDTFNDDDGHPDLFLSSADGQLQRVFRGVGGGDLAGDQDIPFHSCAGGPCQESIGGYDRLASVDLDADGRLDVLRACGGEMRVSRQYAYQSVFQLNEAITAPGECKIGFGLTDRDGRWAPLTLSSATTFLDLDLPDERITLYPHRPDSARDELGEDDYLRALARGDVRQILPHIVYGDQIVGADTDDDGRDELLFYGTLFERGYTLTWRPPGRGLPSIHDIQAAAFDWNAQGGAATRYATAHRLVDVNGDGHLDEVGVLPLWNTGEIRLGRGGSSGFSDEDAVLPIADSVPVSVETPDLNADGVPDLVMVNRQANSLTAWQTPSPGQWTLTLTDPDLPATALVPGRSDLARVRQVFQTVSHVAVLARLEGTGLGGVTLALRAPDGQRVPLGRGPVVGETWIASFRAPEVDFRRLYATQPNGDFTLEAQVEDGVDARLLDFTVVTRGSFVQVQPGFEPGRPRTVRFPGGATGRALADSTLGGRDHTDVSCGDTGDGQPDRWFEGELAAPTALSIQLAAAFGAAVELRAGACSDAGEVLGCATGRGARIEPTTLDAGRFCVVVDGLAERRRPYIQSGHFNLFLRTADAAPDPCAQGGCVEQDARPSAPDFGPDPLEPDAGPPLERDARVIDQDAGVPGQVSCNGEPCDEVCCVGFGGTSCKAACTPFFEIEARCDGPEDCPAGQDCCADQATGAHCAEQCGGQQYEFCHLDDECDDGVCITCRQAGLGDVNMCRVDDCP